MNVFQVDWYEYLYGRQQLAIVGSMEEALSVIESFKQKRDYKEEDMPSPGRRPDSIPENLVKGVRMFRVAGYVIGEIHIYNHEVNVPASRSTYYGVLLVEEESPLSWSPRRGRFCEYNEITLFPIKENAQAFYETMRRTDWKDKKNYWLVEITRTSAND